MGVQLAATFRTRIDVLIPLYGFRSTGSSLKVSATTRILRYAEDDLKRIIGDGSDFDKTFTQRPPDFVICTTLTCEQSILGLFPSPFPESDRLSPDVYNRQLAKTLLEAFADQVKEVLNIGWALRLFKPGEFIKTGYFLIATENVSEIGKTVRVQCYVSNIAPSAIHWVPETREFDFPYKPHTPYSLEPEELPFFSLFRSAIDPALDHARDVAKLLIALSYFFESFADKAPSQQAIDLVTSLEALLLQEEEGLSYRLALRAANLVGHCPEDRKTMFAKVKDLYDLRSKLVHGDLLKSKHSGLLRNVAEMREIVRPILLSVLAITQEIGMGREFYRMLDEMALDDELRTSLRSKSDRLLHLR